MKTVTTALIICSSVISFAPLYAVEQKTFKTPDEAARALFNAAKRGAREEVVAILGEEMRDELSTGNPAQDQVERAVLLKLAGEGIRTRPDPDNPSQDIVYLGQDDWPFPVPLVKTGAAWRFDGKAGLEEIANRALGRNELGAIAASVAYVQAQLEYASADRTGEGILQFAQKIRSTPGRHDGLFWSNDKGEEESPLGPFAAESAAEPGAEGSPTPFFGYRYRILTAQGDRAVGGARNFIVDGHMFGGFALIAWPAEYGVTGVTTFMVNQLGKVYQRDFGQNTNQAVEAIRAFDPDSNWSLVQQ